MANAVLGDLLKTIKSQTDDLPTRLVVCGTEGVGKTSFAAYAPKPVFIMTRGETGLITLMNHGLIPETSHFPPVMAWADLLNVVQALKDEPHDHKTLVIDSVSGAEKMCDINITAKDFQNSDTAFLAYGNGPDASATEWERFLNLLDALRIERQMGIICLGHAEATTFRNPGGQDYKRFTLNSRPKVRSATLQWSDTFLFMNFEDDLDTKGMTAKAKGSTIRLIYTDRTAKSDGKNRVNLPPIIPMGKDGEETWKNFVTAMRNARKKGNS